MSFDAVNPDDLAAVTASVRILNAAMEVDDPTSLRQIPELEADWLRYGWDLEPAERLLYTPPDSDEPVGVLNLEMPTRDNTHLVWAEITVHPAHRRRGFGTVMVEELIRRTEAAGRSTMWLGCANDDPGSQEFVQRFGFRYASHDARRRQRLADVDSATLDRLERQAQQAATDYRLERMVSPVSDEVLAELVEVTSAINDAPMGELTYEDEVFDLARLRDVQTARQKMRASMYRVVARHRQTGDAAGHTVVITHPQQPTWGYQGDTAVSRHHRGHRLGMLLKIDMLRWLADVEPQLEVIETFNHADNDYMISVNEALGYRLSRVYDTFERTLDSSRAAATEGELAAVSAR